MRKPFVTEGAEEGGLTSNRGSCFSMDCALAATSTVDTRPRGEALQGQRFSGGVQAAQSHRALQPTAAERNVGMSVFPLASVTLAC